MFKIVRGSCADALITCEDFVRPFQRRLGMGTNILLAEVGAEIRLVQKVAGLLTSNDTKMYWTN